VGTGERVMEHDECRETYRECTEARKSRARQVFEEAKPGDTEEELAERANVSPRTMRRLKQSLLQKGTPVLNCNSDLEPDPVPREFNADFEREHPNIREIPAR
jgi:hypothetical protein